MVGDALSSALTLHRVSFLLEKIADHASQDSMDLTFSQWMILRSLAGNPSCSQQSIARCRDLTQAAVSRQVEALRAKKLLNRRENPKNRREHILTLTSVGRAKFAAGADLISKSLRGHFAQLDAAQTKALDAALGDLLQSIYAEIRPCGCPGEKEEISLAV